MIDGTGLALTTIVIRKVEAHVGFTRVLIALERLSGIPGMPEQPNAGILATQAFWQCQRWLRHSRSDENSFDFVGG